jgi:thymidylate synthase (FAD)
MKIIRAGYKILNFTPNLEQTIEQAIRFCYKSEDRICEGSAEKIIKQMLVSHHESTLEHGLISVHIICDRGISHEIVRHRIASYSQESTRYCNYSKDKFGNEITVVNPEWAFPDMELDQFTYWRKGCEEAEKAYFDMLEAGAPAQLARSVLPGSLKTELAWSANPREWRSVFKLRTSNAAHPQIVEIMKPMLKEFQTRWPSLFSDITAGEKWEGMFE